MDDAASLRYSVYDPKDLTTEQLMKVLGLDERHRIVDMDGKPIIVDWEKFMEDDRVKPIDDA